MMGHSLGGKIALYAGALDPRVCGVDGAGHTPPKESVLTAYRWLAEQFELPERPVEM